LLGLLWSVKNVVVGLIQPTPNWAYLGVTPG